MVQTHNFAEPSTVSATLHYFVPPADGSRPFQTINSDPATGQRQRNWTQEAHTVKIENLRGKESSVTLDANGFQFISGTQPKHTRFVDDEEIKREYYTESEELLKKVTGASRVVFFDHSQYPIFVRLIDAWANREPLAIRRSNPNQTEDSPDKRMPVSQVHVDQTTASAIARVHRHLPAEDVPELLKHRFQLINLWRPISHPAYEFPLALCDYSTVEPKRDLVPTTLKYPDHDGETNSVKFSPEHRWKYVRGMRPDEAVLIKWYVLVRSEIHVEMC